MHTFTECDLLVIVRINEWEQVLNLLSINVKVFQQVPEFILIQDPIIILIDLFELIEELLKKLLMFF